MPLTKDDVLAIDEAHANLCTAWEGIRAQMLVGQRSAMRSEIRIMNENLDIINEIVRYDRRMASPPKPPANPWAEFHAEPIATPKTTGPLPDSAAAEYERRIREEIAAAEAFDPDPVDVEGLLSEHFGTEVKP